MLGKGFQLGRLHNFSPLYFLPPRFHLFRLPKLFLLLLSFTLDGYSHIMFSSEMASLDLQIAETLSVLLLYLFKTVELHESGINSKFDR